MGCVRRYANGVSLRRSLSEEETGRVVEALRKLLLRYPSQRAMQAATGLKQQSVSRILSGAVPPGYALARDVANVLGVPVEELLTGERPHRDQRLQSLPGWSEASAEAARLYPALSDAIRELGRVAVPEPLQLTPQWIAMMSQVYAQAVRPKR